MRRPLRRHLGNPLLTILLVGLLYADAAYWERSSPTHSSIIGDGLRRIGISLTPVRLPTPALSRQYSDDVFALLVTDERGTLSLVPYFFYNSGEPPYRQLPPDQKEVTVLYAILTPRTRGLLAPVYTRSIPIHTFEGGLERPAGATPTEAQLARGRQLFVQFIPQWQALLGDPPFPHLDLFTDRRIARIHYAHLFHDLLALPIIALAAASLLITPFWVRRQIRSWTVPHGHCRKCRYDLTGLPPDAACPECGTPARPPRTTAVHEDVRR